MRGTLTQRMRMLAMSVAGVMILAGAQAQQGGDLQAQILYAFDTGDLNALAELQSRLRAAAAASPADPGTRYHLAHADFRLAQLYATSQPHAAAKVLGECIDMLKPLLAADGHNVETLILLSRCESALAATGPLDAVLLRRRADERLSTALRLDPHNPRALLVAALRELGAVGADDGARARGLSYLRIASERFTEVSATGTEAPGWGDSEAWVTLGRQLLKSGDVLGARNWIERALSASPDSQDAHRALAELAGH